MKKTFFFIAFILTSLAFGHNAFSQSYGIFFGDLEVTEENADDIFGDGLASYDPESNALELKDGFNYHLSHGKVVISTGDDFVIVLNGKAEIYASVECRDYITFKCTGADTLSITSNISGSALKCMGLTIPQNVCLNLLSRNSQQDMYALDCDNYLTIDGGSLFAEVTTSSLAVKTKELEMTSSYLLKPRGGFVSSTWGGICFADGLPAKVVWIVPDNYYNIGEHTVSNDVSVQKIYENGQIIIIKDGKRYNIAGQLLR